TIWARRWAQRRHFIRACSVLRSSSPASAMRLRGSKRSPWPQFRQNAQRSRCARQASDKDSIGPIQCRIRNKLGTCAERVESNTAERVGGAALILFGDFPAKGSSRQAP